MNCHSQECVLISCEFSHRKSSHSSSVDVICICFVTTVQLSNKTNQSDHQIRRTVSSLFFVFSFCWLKLKDQSTVFLPTFVLWELNLLHTSADEPDVLNTSPSSSASISELSSYPLWPPSSPSLPPPPPGCIHLLTANEKHPETSSPTHVPSSLLHLLLPYSPSSPLSEVWVSDKRWWW